MMPILKPILERALTAACAPGPGLAGPLCPPGALIFTCRAFIPLSRAISPAFLAATMAAVGLLSSLSDFTTCPPELMAIVSVAVISVMCISVLLYELYMCTIPHLRSCDENLLLGLLSSGASAVLCGSVIAYANQVKIDLLKVDPALIEQEGAVSEACAVAMAIGCRNLFQTDWAVAITGIAGPDGGDADKPIGTVWIAVAGPTGTDSHCLQLGGNRARIRKVAALNAHNLVRRQLTR